MNMKPFVLIISIIAVIFISACVSSESAIKEVSLPGHPTYSFSNDIRESLKVSVNAPDAIRRMIMESSSLTFVFDGSSEKDNGSFQVVAFNTITKIQTYFVFEERYLSFPVYYYIGDKWFGAVNGTVVEIEKPQLNGTLVWMKGPNTGANETSIKLENNTILIQGTTHKDITLAGDRLSLIVLGIEKV